MERISNQTGRKEGGVITEIHLLSQSQPIKRSEVENCYTKDGFYCVYENGKVEKYPMVNIFRVKETYT